MRVNISTSALKGLGKTVSDFVNGKVFSTAADSITSNVKGVETQAFKTVAASIFDAPESGFANIKAPGVKDSMSFAKVIDPKTDMTKDFGEVREVAGTAGIEKLAAELDELVSIKQGVEAKLSNIIPKRMLSKDLISEFDTEYLSKGSGRFMKEDLDYLDTAAGFDIVADFAVKIAHTTPGYPLIDIAGRGKKYFIDYVTEEVNGLRGAFKYDPKKSGDMLTKLTKAAVQLHNLNTSAYREYLASTVNPSKGSLTLRYLGNAYSSLSEIAEVTDRAGMTAISTTMKEASEILRGADGLKTATVKRSFDIMKTYDLAVAETPDNAVKLQNFFQSLIDISRKPEEAIAFKPTFDEGPIGSVEKELYKFIIRSAKTFDPTYLDDNALNYAQSLSDKRVDFGFLSTREEAGSIVDLVGKKSMHKVAKVLSKLIDPETNVMKPMTKELFDENLLSLRQSVELKYVGNAYEQAKFMISSAKNYAAPLDMLGDPTKEQKKTVLDNYFKIAGEHLDNASNMSEPQARTPWGAALNAYARFNVSTMMFSDRLWAITMLQPWTQQTFDYGNLLGKADGVMSKYPIPGTLRSVWDAKGLFSNENRTPVDSMIANNKLYSELMDKFDAGTKMTQAEMLLANGLIEANVYSGTTMADSVRPSTVFKAAIEEANPGSYASLQKLFGDTAPTKVAGSLDWISNHLGKTFAMFEKGTRMHLFMDQYTKAVTVVDDAFNFKNPEIDNIMSALKRESGKIDLPDVELDIFYRRLAVHKYLNEKLKLNRFRHIDKHAVMRDVDNIFNVLHTWGRDNENYDFLKEDIGFCKSVSKVGSTFARGVIDQTVFNYSPTAKPGVLGALSAAAPALSPALTFMSFNFHALQQFSAVGRLYEAGDKQAAARAAAIGITLFAGWLAADVWAQGDALTGKSERNYATYVTSYALGKAPFASTVVGLGGLPSRPLAGPMRATLQPLIGTAMTIKAATESKLFDDAPDFDVTKSLWNNVIKPLPQTDKIKMLFDVVNDASALGSK